MIALFVEKLVRFSRKFAFIILAGYLFLCCIGILYTQHHLSMNTDTTKLFSPEIPWRKNKARFETLFPQLSNTLLIVVDGKTPELSNDAAVLLTEKMHSNPDLFKNVHLMGGEDFFKKNGFLFLKEEELNNVAQELIQSQPLLGVLAKDPSLKGLMDAFTFALEGVVQGAAKLDDFQRPFAAIYEALHQYEMGNYKPVSWQSLLMGRAPKPEELRRLILVQPVLNFNSLTPGKEASTFIRDTVKKFNLTTDHGVQVRLTGNVALSDEEFVTVADSTSIAGIVSAFLVLCIIFLAMRSWKLVLATMITLIVGLILTAFFAALTIGSLNLISVACFVLFVGIAVDFSIQFVLRYREQRHIHQDLIPALDVTAKTIGRSLFLAAITIAVGFYAFLPTSYVGVSELGFIAGSSMFIAVLLNVTLLPALIFLLKPGMEKKSIDLPWLANFNQFLINNRKTIITIAVVILGLALVLCYHIKFDSDPLKLKNPKTESVSTLMDLMSDSLSTPYVLDAIIDNANDYNIIKDRLEKLPEVKSVLSVMRFVPTDQDKKLLIIEDLKQFLLPTLNPPSTFPVPTADQVKESIVKFTDKLESLNPAQESVAGHLLQTLHKILDQNDPQLVEKITPLIVQGLPEKLDILKQTLQAGKVTLDDIPGEIKRDWITSQGQLRLTIYPKENLQEKKSLIRFVEAVRQVTPNVSGLPVSIVESGKTILNAFIMAAGLALIAIFLVLYLVLKRVYDVLLVLMPPFLAAFLTGAVCVLIDMPINLANIITFPLQLGVGVAFSIYYVIRWRQGMDKPLQSSMTRAIFFSALTTSVAFGSLAISTHPGTADMGKMLFISLFFILVVCFTVLLAFLKPLRS
ncbi:MAG: MMPL family transporter [Alphaproteobacteria bacterium]|nr:MMPL family transporter [Alphaproteobacteria bacterium]